MESYADLINLWPSAEAFARDLGISGVRARAWKNRNSIPGSFWLPVIAAAERRGIAGVTLGALSLIAAHKIKITAAPEAA